MAIKFNVDPYYDDFEVPTAVDGLSPKDKYYRVLFRPGHAVQGRELTQLQSILQNQVNQFGRHFFEEGSMVIPGAVASETSIDYIKVDSIAGVGISDLEGLELTGQTSGLKIRIKKAIAAEDPDPITIYVKYLNSGTLEEKVAEDGEVFTDGNAIVNVVATDSTGLGSVVFLDNGVYFIEGNFVAVQQQSIVLEKYETDPSYDIGLNVIEKIQTPAGDPSINDNATGTPNYAAPGAHRYEIKTELVKQAIGGTTYENFVLLARIDGGTVSQRVRGSDYSIIEEELARRTFDESGNYTVRPFMINVREHTDVNTPGDEAKLSIGVEPSKAYVRGYELETLATKYVNVNKARESSLFEAASVPTQIGNYIQIENVVGLPDIATYTNIELKDQSSTIIGFARARSIVFDGNGVYRLFLFDIRMNEYNPGQFRLFQDTRTLRMAGVPEFTADVILTNGNAIIQEPNRNSMVFPLPFSRVKTCNSQPEGVNADYNFVYFTNRYVGDDTVAGGEANFSTVSDQEQFEPFDDENWLLTVSVGAATGTIIPLTSSQIQLSGDSQSVTITGLGTYESQQVKLIAGTKRSIQHKNKSLTTNGAPNIDLWPEANPTDTIRLGKADGYKLRAVYMSSDLSTPATTSDTEVSEYYDFNNGQTDNYYDLAAISLKPYTAFRPTGQLLIKYEYFTHTGSGDFFTVDSYENLTDSEGVPVEYEDIPSFESNTGQTIELRSAVDFRPRVSDSGDAFDVGTGAVLAACPEPQTTFTTDIQYYLNRIDKLYIDKDGKFGITEGVPAINPDLPEDPKDSMVLYHLFIPAYTLDPTEVGVTMIDNKRYTMRDIGKLEQRINTLEYYTSLSLLEKEAADKQILDPATATQRAKAGFIVDSFTSHNTGNVTNPEFRAAIDRDTRTLRPLFSQDNTKLVFNSALSSNVQRTGSLVTLPYTEQNFIDQNQASDVINVNPFDVFVWTGTVELSPTTDEWKDTSRRPNVIVDQEGIYDAMLGIINETDALGTVWNSWQTNWSGVVDTQRSGEQQSGRRVFRTVTETIQANQSRRGLETRVVPDTITTNLGDRVVEINFAPFIRSRIVHFKATRMKPNTKVYAFFDGVNVDSFVRTEDQFYHYEDLDNPTIVGVNGYSQHPVGPTELVTDDSGTVVGSFFIPNNTSVNFQTGTRIFKLCDDPTNSQINITTQAEAAYTAKGLIETKENVTISTRVPLIERREVFDDRIVTNTRSREETVRWVDPLAQSFMIDTPGGAFLTSIELFFYKKSENIPVTIQIREMNQGIPTQTIVPFSEVTLDGIDVNVVDLNQAEPDPSVATKFNFSSPVYLQENQEYCFVVLANTNEYEVWYAEIGGDNYSTGNKISKQPYAGVLFKSQNASTWSPDQNKDLKFRINVAEFDINSAGTVILNNGSVADRQLNNNPFETTAGSNIITVHHRNHHMYESVNNITSFVNIQNSTDVNGIPSTEINGVHAIFDVEMDRYKIAVTSNATGSGIDGGADVTASENQAINVFYPFVQQMNFPGTSATWGVRLSSGTSLGDATTTPYITDQSFSPVIVNQNYGTEKPRVIASDVNEQSGRTFFLRGSFVSTRSNISPVIDLERCSVFTVANRIDNPTGASVPLQDRPAGSHIVDNFVDETVASGGSVAAKYVTKAVKLAEASDGLRIYFDAQKLSGTDIKLFYKAVANDVELPSTEWIESAPLNPIPVNDEAVFTEVEYFIDPPLNFTSFVIKIVMTSRNTSRIPLVRDLRIIAVLP